MCEVGAVVVLGGEFLYPSLGEAQRRGVFYYAGVFLRFEGAVEGGWQPFARREVLRHKREVQITEGGELVGQPVEAAQRVVDGPRKYQMPHDEAAVGAAVGVDFQSGAHLPLHLAQRRHGHLGVVGGMAVGRRQRRIHVFEVGQVDVDQPLEGPQCLDALVAAAVVDNRGGGGVGGGQSGSDGIHQFGDVVGIVCRCHKPQHPATFRQEAAYLFGEMIHGLLFPFPSFRFADLPVLAVDTLQVAVGEEDVDDGV